MSYDTTCNDENCQPSTLPGSRHLHRYLHDNVSWYRDWHHHPFRPHVHMAALLVATLIAGFVLLAPNNTGLKAETGGYPVAGRLLESDNQPVRDGTHEAIFRLYQVQSGGTPVWTEVHTGADRMLTINGYYTVVLGMLTQFDKIDMGKSQYYLGISIDGQSELSPRWPLSEIPLQVTNQ